MKRKTFIERTTATTAGFTLLNLLKPVEAAALTKNLQRIFTQNAQVVATDEEFWDQIRNQYTVKGIINLNNGGVSPQPKPVQKAHIENYEFCNQGPSYYMWRMLDKQREPLRQKLAEITGTTAEEIAINRNTTEGLNTIIFGLKLKAGDEVVLSKFDYPNMMNAWKQREARDGIKLNWVNLNLPEEDDEAIVKKYEAAITPNTKIVHVTHMLNWTGQIMPARKIADMAHAKGCEVIVDGSHSFAHINYKITDLDCDYYATSLHKWMCAPFGTGFMYIKKEKIGKVWALLSAPYPDATNIGKFEAIGTRSFAAEMAAKSAIEFQEMIGNERKEARLRYLKDYWMSKVTDIPGVHFYTSNKPAYSCAIATFGIAGKKGNEIADHLFNRYNIHTTNIDHEGLNGVRVSPHVYTSLQELDTLVKAIKELATEK